MTYDQKILIIRFSSIGDIVLATSALRTIRNKFPKSEITFLTLDTYAPLLEFHPDLDILISIKKSLSFYGLFKYSKFLSNKNFSIVFDLHNSIRSKILIFGLKSKKHILIKPRWKRFMLFYLFYNLFKKDFSTVRMYHNYLGKIWHYKNKIPKSFLKITSNEKRRALLKLKSYGIERNFFVFIPGAAWDQKCWDQKKYIELINKLNLNVVLLGSKTDLICFEISKKLKKVINLAGKTSLRDAMAIIYNAYYVVGSDTGLTHIAEALGKNVSMILGPTSSQTGANIILKESKIIEKNIWCRPCSQNGKRKCYRTKQFCMDLITVNDVYNSIPI